MHRRLALLTLVLAILGCERYRSPRAQGPFNRQPTKPNPALARSTPPAGAGGLALSTPASPLPPTAPDEAQPVPPRPPEPTPVGSAVAPPQGARPPAVYDPKVQPAAGTDANADPERRKILPRRNEPPAPKAPVANAPTTPPATAPAQPSSAAVNLAALKKLYQTGAEKWKTIDTYEARFVRREVVGNTQGPTEEVFFQFRKEPMAVYMKSVGEAGKGREVLYNPSQHGEKVYVIVGEGDSRLYRPGSKGPAMSPDSPLVRSKSRHSIRESGCGVSLEKFAALVAKVETGKLPADSVKYAGVLKREEFGDTPLEGVEQTVRPGDEEGVPTGGVRHWFFDAKPGSPSAGLAVLVVLYDDKGKELEYYRYTQVKAPAGLKDADFDPARMGKK